ncbi:hypothetical protein TNIN_164641 [Trichonephila inaurata madagascariensis]|uniref:Uncharacterized protein n=1 Tax=Trichonephila inaurata madagascariensis TaxID=2747483 RepID=A0A8X6IDU1_9ARAC|nr:hypothetical protein TNIN_164641 [Trichonephila inaurata madagascariensis]
MTSSKSTMHRLLRFERLYPFWYTTMQGLKPDDCQIGVAFVNGCCSNRTQIMVSLHIFCGLMKHVSLVMGYSTITQQPFGVPGQSACNPAAETSGTLVS